MNVEFEIYSMGYKNGDDVLWSAILLAKAEDGQVKEKTIVQRLPMMTKNQADILSISRALQCIRPGYRGQCKVVFHPPPGYAAAMLEKTMDGLWKSEPKANHGEVRAARDAVNRYANLEIQKIDMAAKMVKRCVELARNVTQPTE